MRRCELLIVGGGPAGLTAYIYAARARIDTVLLERLSPGGQVMVTDEVENYPGFPKIKGVELMQRFVEHAEGLGLKPVLGEARALKLDGNLKRVELSDGTSIECKALIIATGASPRKLGVKGEKEFLGKGVSYCATCDGPFFKDEVVAVVGGGNTAVQEAVFLTKFVKKLYLIHRRDALRATKILQERAFSNPKIEFVWNTVVEEIFGRERVEGVRLFNKKEGRRFELEVSGVFVFVGIEPQTEWVKGVVELDERGFVKTDAETRTSVPGIFAAGDVRAKACRQIVTAAGDGATAAYMAELYLSEHET